MQQQVFVYTELQPTRPSSYNKHGILLFRVDCYQNRQLCLYKRESNHRNEVPYGYYVYTRTAKAEV